MKFLTELKSKILLIYKKHGWKALVGILAYYLLRDLTIYVALPYFLISN